MTTRVRSPIQPGDGDPRHGTFSAYTNHACRCPLCKEANRVTRNRYLAKRAERQGRP